MIGGMTLQPLGESAFLVLGLEGASSAAWAREIRAWQVKGVLEVVPAYDTLGLYVEPENFDPARFFARVSKAKDPAEQGSGRHTVPVCYGFGEDLSETSALLGLSPEQLIAAHTGRPYRCFAVGFCPGFPYLGPLEASISGLSRRASPRPRVEAGTVAITGDQTGIYTLPRPGGWHLVGKTPLQLVDVAAGYFPISAGDEVIFVAIDEEEYAYLEGERL